MHKPGDSLWSTTCILLLLTLVLASCATLPDNSDRTYSEAITDTDDTRLGKIANGRIVENPEKSGFVLLGSGLDAFVARAVLAAGADGSIDAQYYLFHNDSTGILLLDQLIEAAERGVRVRLLVDDMDMADRDLGAVTIDSHPNFEVRLFNPFSRESGRVTQLVTRFGSVTRRMHNKSFIVDNQFAIVGGRNIGDEYFEANPDLAFGDLDVMAIGPVVAEVSAAFDEYWNNALAFPITTLVESRPTAKELAEMREQFKQSVAGLHDSEYLQALRDSTLAESMRNDNVRFYWGQAEVVHDSPDKISEARDRKDLHLSNQLKLHFDNLNDELIIFSPYFIPGKEGLEFLTSLSERGVRVRILTNSLSSTDVSVVHAGYAKYRKRLLRGGVELYEVNKRPTEEKPKVSRAPGSSGKASLHAKSFVFDREEVFIGSLNLDPRSLVENTEIGIVLSSPEMGREMSDWFDNNIERLAFRLELDALEGGGERIVWHGLENGQPVTYTKDPYTGFWQRFGVSAMSLLPVESQL